jgi:hypothetical protein
VIDRHDEYATTPDRLRTFDAGEHYSDSTKTLSAHLTRIRRCWGRSWMKMRRIDDDSRCC